MSRLLAALVTISIALGASISWAQKNPHGLPGVKQPKGIVTRPKPEPDGFSLEQRAVQIGDWDVRISGNVTIDIGTFQPRPGR
jgi:hypothetical protein